MDQRSLKERYLMLSCLPKSLGQAYTFYGFLNLFLITKTLQLLIHCAGNFIKPRLMHICKGSQTEFGKIWGKISRCVKMKKRTGPIILSEKEKLRKTS